MNKKHLFIACFVFLFSFTKAQDLDTTATVNKTQIDIVYNNYIQNGNNSAVTGGIGTEKLTVYGPAVTLKKKMGKRSLKINSGADVISSASTDNINFVMSSASSLDTRFYTHAEYEQEIKGNGISLYGGLGMSIESDYFSVGSRVGFLKKDEKKIRQYSVEFQMFNDDLRWGRLDAGEWKPQKLIYPSELRNQEWYDIYRRHSFNLKLGFSTAINKRSIVGIYPVFSFQKGLLATPFHRIYFKDDSQAVEKLPEKRTKVSIGLKWNQFVKGRYILKNTINPFIDDWGILSLSLKNETAIKLNPIWTLLPNFRFYMQRGTSYFSSYGEHSVFAEYYTSDYDLSTHRTYNIGFGVKFLPYHKFAKYSHFNIFILRYNYISRSDGLSAHIISLNIQLEKKKNKKRKK